MFPLHSGVRGSPCLDLFTPRESANFALEYVTVIKRCGFNIVLDQCHVNETRNPIENDTVTL